MKLKACVVFTSPDIDECVTSSPCDQICTDNEGSYVCSCNPGFTASGNTCSGEYRYNPYFSIFSFNNVNIILVFSNNVNIILAFSNNINIILAFQQLPAEVNIFWCFNIIFYFTFLKHVKVKKLL